MNLKVPAVNSNGIAVIQTTACPAYAPTRQETGERPAQRTHEVRYL